MSAPAGKPNDMPRWINPCSLPYHVFDPSRDMNGAPAIPMDVLYSDVIKRSTISRDHAMEVKDSFLSEIDGDEDFEIGVANRRQDWILPIPEATEEHFRTMTNETAFPKAYEYLQYFGVGMEQILLDQVLHDGKLTTDFRDVENYLTQLLCELQLAMHILHIAPNPDVMRRVMSQRYRDISKSQRELRDYLILRDYIKTTDYIVQLFTYLKQKNSS